jgi:pilus assembly protein Flp/PilA
MFLSGNATEKLVEYLVLIKHQHLFPISIFIIFRCLRKFTSDQDVIANFDPVRAVMITAPTSQQGAQSAHLRAESEFLTMKLLSKFAKCESGATAIEYGLIAALIGVVIIGTVRLVGTSLVTVFTNINEGLSGATSG